MGGRAIVYYMVTTLLAVFLGIALVRGPHKWHTGFVAWTIGFTLVCRFIGKCITWQLPIANWLAVLAMAG